MLNLNLVKGENSYQASSSENGTAPSEDNNYGETVITSLVAPWAGRGYTVVEQYYNFASVQPAK